MFNLQGICLPDMLVDTGVRQEGTSHSNRGPFHKIRDNWLDRDLKCIKEPSTGETGWNIRP